MMTVNQDVEGNTELPEERHSSRKIEENNFKIDLSHKIFLLEWVNKNYKSIYKLNGEEISEKIFVTHGIFISSHELY